MEKKVDYTNLTIEEIEKTISDIFYGNRSDKKRDPECISISETHYRVTANGITAVVPKKEFDEALKKEALKLTK